MYRICQHILTTGLRCKSPALRTDDFCYFHTAFRRQQRELASERNRPPEFIAPNFNSNGDFTSMGPVRPRDIEFTRGVIRKPMEVDLGLLEDAAAIQLAISNVLQALDIGRLETRRASVLLYGLQLASNNARLLPETETAAQTREPAPVESRTCNPAPMESGTCKPNSMDSATCKPAPMESGTCEVTPEGDASTPTLPLAE